MLYRLGQVLWWASIAIGSSIFVGAFLAALNRQEGLIVAAIAGVGAFVILFGRAIRYIICGD